MKLKNFKHKLEYFFLFFLICFFRSLPINLCYKISKLLGNFIYYFVPIRKKTAYYNLKRAFPAKTDKEIFEIIRKMYINFLYFILESIIMNQKLKPRFDENIKIYGIEKLQEAFIRGNGVVLYTAHLGNWHVMGAKLVALGFPVNNIVKRQRNPYVFDEEINAMLETGMKITVLQKTPKNIFKALKDGDVVEFLADQDAGTDGVFIDFFGEKASAAVGPAIFALKMNAPIIFAIDIRDDKYKHSIFLETIDSSSLDVNDENVKNLTETLSKKLEDYILKYPEQYFWLHKRWMTRPKN